MSVVADPRLSAVIAGLEETGWAAELCAPDWTLVHVTGQLKTLLGAQEDDVLGIGTHMVASRMREDFVPINSPLVLEEWIRTNVPHMIEATPGGREAIAAMVGPDYAHLLEDLEVWRFPIWTGVSDFRGTALAPIGRVRYFGVRARGLDGEEIGTIYLYGSSLPATLLALVARGDVRMLERMAAVAEPGRRRAAILFADVQASGSLSRRLPSARYFQLMQALATQMDAVVIDRDGIVGKHAGDGVTAYFLAQEAEQSSQAARRAIEAARGLRAAAGLVGDEAGVELALNVGIHWGGTLFMGQVATDGRLEVTALGDEVNECARMQQTARDGAVLASKALIERLDPADAAVVGVDTGTVSYGALSDLPGAAPKAVRDAGGLAVTRI